MQYLVLISFSQLSLCVVDLRLELIPTAYLVTGSRVCDKSDKNPLGSRHSPTQVLAGASTKNGPNRMSRPRPCSSAARHAYGMKMPGEEHGRVFIGQY